MPLIKIKTIHLVISELGIQKKNFKKILWIGNKLLQWKLELLKKNSKKSKLGLLLKQKSNHL